MLCEKRRDEKRREEKRREEKRREQNKVCVGTLVRYFRLANENPKDSLGEENEQSKCTQSVKVVKVTLTLSAAGGLPWEEAGLPYQGGEEEVVAVAYPVFSPFLVGGGSLRKS